MKYRVFDRVIDATGGFGLGVVVDIEANPHKSDEDTILTIDFGDNVVFKRYADEVRGLPSVITAKGHCHKFTEGEFESVDLGNFNITPFVLELEWNDFIALDDGVNATNLLSDRLPDVENHADFDILDSICAYFGTESVDFNMREAVYDGRINERLFDLAKELYNRYFKEMHIQQDIQNTSFIKKELKKEFSAWIEKACDINKLGVAEDELEDLMQFVMASAFNVAEGLRDVVPAVRFGQAEEPCWKVEMIVPVSEMGVEKRNYALIHGKTEKDARETAMQLIRMHMKNAMRLARTGDVEPYDPETQYDEFDEDLQAEI